MGKQFKTENYYAKQHKASVKVFRTIQSCVTLDQLVIAGKLLDLYVLAFPDAPRQTYWYFDKLQELTTRR